MRRSTTDVPEHTLRHLWTARALRRELLTSVDGRHVEVVDAGTINLHSGPDFLNARIRIDGTMHAGDVEFHRTDAEWVTHGHSADPRYNRVILHVVLDACRTSTVTTASGRQVPNLFLSGFLTESPQILRHRAELAERHRASQTIPCAELNYSVPPELLEHWISLLASERLELKRVRFDERLQEHIRTTSGPALGGDIPLHEFSRREHWEQVFYEGLMDGLGYVRNRVPFLRLAQSVTLQRVASLGIADTPLLIEALLFGAAGLIPPPSAVLSRPSKRYVTQLHEAWEALRHRYRGPVLHAADWSFSPTRPANYPTGRIATAAGLVHAFLRKELLRRAFGALLPDVPPSVQLRQVMQTLGTEPGPYWRKHYHFDRVNTSETLRLGEARKRELITNVFVPLVLCYTCRSNDLQMRSRALALFGVIPSSGGNSVSRLIEGHLLRGKIALTRAPAEQGAIELFHFYCMRGRCGDCAVGKELGLRN